MAELIFNAVSGKFDFVGMTSEEVDAFLKLDQTTRQTVINGAPQFNKGIVLKTGEKLIFDGS